MGPGAAVGGMRIEINTAAGFQSPGILFIGRSQTKRTEQENCFSNSDGDRVCPAVTPHLPSLSTTWSRLETVFRNGPTCVLTLDLFLSEIDILKWSPNICPSIGK